MRTIDNKLFTQINKARQLAAGCLVLSEFNGELDGFLTVLQSVETKEACRETKKQFAYWINSVIKTLRKERMYIERRNLKDIQLDSDMVYKIQLCIDSPLDALGLADSFQAELSLSSYRNVIEEYMNEMEVIASEIKKLQVSEQTAYKYIMNNAIDKLVFNMEQKQDELKFKTARFKKISSQLLLQYRECMLNQFEIWIKANSLKINQYINQYIINCWNYKFSNIYTQPNLKRENRILLERMLDMAMEVYKERTDIIYEVWEDWAGEKLYDLPGLEKDFSDGFLTVINALLAEYLTLNLSGIYKKLPEVKAGINKQMEKICSYIEVLQVLEDNYQQLLKQVLSGYNE